MARYTRGRQQSQQQQLRVSSLSSPSPLDMPGNVVVFSLPTSFRARRIRPPVRQLALLSWTACALLPLPLLEAGRPWEVVRVLTELRQTVAPPSFPHLQQGLCQTASPSFRRGILAHVGHRTGTSRSIRPGARLNASCARIVSTWGYRGVRVGEASHPGPGVGGATTIGYHSQNPGGG